MIVFAAVLGAIREAAAEPEREGRVALAVSSCGAAFASALREILRIELGDLLDEAPSLEATELERIEIACGTETVSVSARSARGDQVVHNDLRLDAFPVDAAPRAVALSALEALRAVDPTLLQRIEAQRRRVRPSALRAPSANEPAPAATVPVAASSQPTPRASTRLMLGGALRSFLGGAPTTTFGARLELSVRLAAPWDFGFDADGLVVRRRVELGAVDARTLSAAAWFGPRLGGTQWSGTFGLGGRFGIAALRGAPDTAAARGRRVTRPWAGPLVAIRTDGILPPAAVAFVVEGGLAAISAEGLAAGVTAIAVKGVWVAVSANGGFRF